MKPFYALAVASTRELGADEMPTRSCAEATTRSARRPCVAELQQRPKPEDEPDERDKTSTQHLAVSRQRAEAQALQSRTRRHAEEHVGRDGGRAEHERHRADHADSILARREER